MAGKFTSLALDQLIRDCTGQTEQDQIGKQLAQYDDSKIQPAVNPQLRGMIQQNQGTSVDFNRVYNQLQKLIQNGNNAMQLLASLDPNCIDPGTIASTASLMNSIKNCISQFTKIHAIHIKHHLARQLAAQQFQYKKQLLEMKLNAKNGKQEEQAHTVTEFSDQTTNAFYKYMNQLKKQKQQKQLN